MTKRLGVAAVFLVGCAVGGASSQLVVPKASAQQAATLTKWEVYCERADNDQITGLGNKLGREAWELVGSSPSLTNMTWCFKRPKM